MLERDRKRKHFSAVERLWVVAIALMVLAVGSATAQDPNLAIPPNAIGTSAIPLGKLFGDGLSFSTAARAGSGWWAVSDAPAGGLAGGAASTEERPIRSGGIRRITLEQVKQQRFVNPTTSPLARLSQLSIEAAKQHRLGVQADYFPKLGATFANLHYSQFLGQVLSVRRPIAGSLAQIPVPLFSQNWTIAAVTFTQPITPLFMVNQAVRIARAEERIAMAKAGVSAAKNARDIEIEEVYFKLLIAQRQLTSAELKLRRTENQPLYAAASVELVRGPVQEPDLVRAKKALLTAATEVRELIASLNRVMGWPDETELELVPPDPLVESISLEEVADKSAAS
jgi:outer membrane protein TolC